MNLRSWLLIGLAIISVLHVSCAQSGRYPMRLEDSDTSQLLETATTVVVAKTVGVEGKSARQPVHWDRQPGVTSARLVKVKLLVEQVIRGSGNAAELTVYYWAPDVYTTGGGLHLPMLGERAVHYLVTDQGVLRYVTDLGLSTTRFFTGYHRQPPWATGTGPEAKIAALLLTPGEKLNIGDFTRNLGTATGVSKLLVGYVGTLPLLDALARNPVWDVRWTACVSLYEYRFKGHDGCIDELAAEAVEHGREAELRRLQSFRLGADQEFRTAFLLDPLRTAIDYATLPGPTSGIADFLNLLAQHPDRQIAARAREELRTRHLSGPGR